MFVGTLYAGSVFYWRIFSPLLDFRMISDDTYECDSFEKHVYLILTYWQEISIPLILQISFVGIIWQMTRIQTNMMSY